MLPWRILRCWYVECYSIVVKIEPYFLFFSIITNHGFQAYFFDLVNHWTFLENRTLRVSVEDEESAWAAAP